jgi:periplasmic protein TonB
MFRVCSSLLIMILFPISANAQTTPEMTSWYLSISSHIKRFQKFPPNAKLRGERGEVFIKFTIDPTGHLIDSVVAKPSCFDDLNKEALATVRRAEPFPPFPSTIKKTRLTFTQPIVFAKDWKDALRMQAQSAAIGAKGGCDAVRRTG